MPCEVTTEQLAAFLSGELEPERTNELGDHIERCADCRERLDELDQVDSALASLRRYEPSARMQLEARQLLSQELRGKRTPDILTLREVAEYLRISPDQLDEVAAGLPAFEIAGQVRVRRDRLIEWVEQRELAYLRRSIESSIARSLGGDMGRGVA